MNRALPGVFLIQVNPLKLKFLNPTKNISVDFPSSPIKIWGIIVKEFLSYDKTSKQRVLLYIYRYYTIFYSKTYFNHYHLNFYRN